MVKLSKIMRGGKAMYLAYDQGLEHGPSSDFNDKNVDPLFVLDIAKLGKFQGVVFHKGIAEKYHAEIKASKIPLILKLNGKTRLSKGEPIAEPICTVKEAVKLGASAVGFTIYIGSEYEAHMIHHFSRIQLEAHKKGLPVILWVYPRGKSVKNDVSRENIAYAARFGLEIGADIVKLKWNGNLKDLQWVVKSAGRTKVVVAGGTKRGENEFLKQVRGIRKAGAAGLAVGRNVWQSKEPIKLSRKIGKIIFN
jgi:fructose-bisphosphate aldolase, class I